MNTPPPLPRKRVQKAAALAQSLQTDPPSLDQRLAAGKALRDAVPRESHSTWTRQPGVDLLRILREQAKTRRPELVPVRYARMLQSPFAFLRGSAAVMAADLSSTPVSGLQVAVCGDMHVANFGVFA